MSTHTLAAWLRCPNCSSALEALGPLLLGCNEDHRFDVNKRGYLTLLPSRAQIIGDDEDMLDHRATVLDGSAYAPIMAALGRAVPLDASCILDAGCGTGHYLHRVLASRPDARGLAMDLSPIAVRRAVRGRSDVDGLVADTWSPLPIRDTCCDVVLNVFAPRNLPEFHRVLRQDGRLIVVVPDAEHLSQLRTAVGLLEVPEQKAQRLAEQASASFTLEHGEQVRYDLALNPALAHHLAAMGPAARHGALVQPSDVPETVTVAVDVLAFVRR